MKTKPASRRLWWRQKEFWSAAAGVALLHAVLLGDAPLAFLEPQAPALAATASTQWVALVGDVRAAEPPRVGPTASATAPRAVPAPRAQASTSAPSGASTSPTPAPAEPLTAAPGAETRQPTSPSAASESGPRVAEAVQVAAEGVHVKSEGPPEAFPQAREAAHDGSPSGSTNGPPSGSNTASQTSTVEPPVYPARLPPDFAWRYSLRRGVLSGQADLVLQVKDGAYVLDLRGTALGLEILGLRSQGAITAHGLKPLRFVERRLGRDRLAANFDWPQARLTYSGPTTVRELWPGTQDRLSWMVQLGAVIDAQPERFRPGEVVQLTITTVRADVDTWAFQVAGFAMLERPGQPPLRTLHITRQPLRPYDTQVDIWLDPLRHHLPVHARLATQPNGDALDLRLQE